MHIVSTVNPRKILLTQKNSAFIMSKASGYEGYCWRYGRDRACLKMRSLGGISDLEDIVFVETGANDVHLGAILGLSSDKAAVVAALYDSKIRVELYHRGSRSGPGLVKADS